MCCVWGRALYCAGFGFGLILICLGLVGLVCLIGLVSLVG
jgi:hypothetical protein